MYVIYKLAIYERPVPQIFDWSRARAKVSGSSTKLIPAHSWKGGGGWGGGGAFMAFRYYRSATCVRFLLRSAGTNYLARARWNTHLAVLTREIMVYSYSIVPSLSHISNKKCIRAKCVSNVFEKDRAACCNDTFHAPSATAISARSDLQRRKVKKVREDVPKTSGCPLKKSYVYYNNAFYVRRNLMQNLVSRYLM